MKTNLSQQRSRQASFSGLHNTFGDFVCMVCHNFVSAETALSGVQNRNHCPNCLSSRHLDLFEAGDRLSACKANMHPVALTLKKTSKKYTRAGQGELMLVHLCSECGKTSINRIAADDDIEAVLKIFEKAQGLDTNTKSALRLSGVAILEFEQQLLVREQLLGETPAFAGLICVTLIRVIEDLDLCRTWPPTLVGGLSISGRAGGSSKNGNQNLRRQPVQIDP